MAGLKTKERRREAGVEGSMREHPLFSALVSARESKNPDVLAG